MIPVLLIALIEKANYGGLLLFQIYYNQNWSVKINAVHQCLTLSLVQHRSLGIRLQLFIQTLFKKGVRKCCLLSLVTTHNAIVIE